MSLNTKTRAVKVIGWNKLEEFGAKHADVLSQLRAWLAEAKDAQWKSPLDVKNRYRHASLLSDNRVVFNIKGNRYRLEVLVHYPTGVVFVKRVGTHAEYSKWNL